MSNAEKTVMFALPNTVQGQLACVAGTAAGRSWDVSAGTFVIGRLDDNDLPLPQEPGVSKVHAKIIGQAERYLIMDCESRNGTLLNGQLIQRADLYDGDEIKICGCTLRFTQKGGPARPRARPPVADPTTAPSSSPVGPPTALMPAAPMSLAPVAAAQNVGGGGKVLAVWYAAGLVGSLLLGGAASAALVVTAPPPKGPEIAAAAPVTAPPGVPVVSPPAQPTPVATVATPVASAVDAGAANVASVAAIEAAVPPTPTPEVEAAAAVPEPEVVEPEPESKSSKRRTRRSRETSTASIASSASSEPATPGEPQLYGATVDGGKAESLRSRTGGRVKTVEAKEGDLVSKGQTLVTFESGADPGEIATLQDRIASLENAEDDEAKRELRQAKQKLAALEGGKKAEPLFAPFEGKLTGFNVTPGSVLKGNEVVGKVVDGDVPSRVRITVPKGTKVEKGQTVVLVLRTGGTSDGTVVAISGRTVTVDTGTEPGDAVEAVKF